MALFNPFSVQDMAEPYPAYSSQPRGYEPASEPARTPGKGETA